MSSLKVNIQAFFKYQKPLVESSQFLRRLQALRFSTSPGVTQEEPKNSAERKIVKAAIVGRPNAGKSTLINGMLNLNVCGASCKSHTTKTPFQAAFTRGDTQVVFVDTPGLVTRKEFSRFNLSEDFVKWKENVLNAADVIGVVHEVLEPRDLYKLHLNLTQNINDFPESKTLFLLLNKLDLVLDKEALTAAVENFMRPENLEKPSSHKTPKIMRRFSKVFFISALKNLGLNEVVDYLVEQAKPGEWLFEPGQVFNEPLHIVVRNLVRAHFLQILPSEVPYECTYEVEYLKEDELGEIFCVCLVTCSRKRHHHLITSGKMGSLRSISKKMESDLYKILGKVFKIRLVVRLKK